MVEKGMIRRSLRKALQAVIVCAVILGVLWFAWPPAIQLPQIWLVMGISILANVLQPTYRLFEGSRTQEDRWTAAQIVWTVYLTQIAALVELAVKQPDSMPMDVVSWSALFILVAGLLLRTWAVIILDKFFTWNIEVRPGQKIIQAGPYRILRHPGYSGAFLMFVASCVLLHSWVSAGLAAAALALAFQRRIRHEERLLKATFPEYEEYASRIGGLVPRIY